MVDGITDFATWQMISSALALKKGVIECHVDWVDDVDGNSSYSNRQSLPDIALGVPSLVKTPAEYDDTPDIVFVVNKLPPEQFNPMALQRINTVFDRLSMRLPFRKNGTLLA